MLQQLNCHNAAVQVYFYQVGTCADLLHGTGRLVVSLGRSLLESLVEIPLVKLHMPDLLQMLQDAVQVAVILRCITKLAL